MGGSLDKGGAHEALPGPTVGVLEGRARGSAGTGREPWKGAAVTPRHGRPRCLLDFRAPLPGGERGQARTRVRTAAGRGERPGPHPGPKRSLRPRPPRWRCGARGRQLRDEMAGDFNRSSRDVSPEDGSSHLWCRSLRAGGANGARAPI